MTDNTENLILEHLRALRAGMEKIDEKVTFLTARVTSSIEQQLAGVHVDLATMNARFDSVGKKLDRIERRLELTSV